jgi:hypothetical protein
MIQGLSFVIILSLSLKSGISTTEIRPSPIDPPIIKPLCSLPNRKKGVRWMYKETTNLLAFSLGFLIAALVLI